MSFDRARVDRMITKMDEWLSQREQQQEARHDIEDQEMEEELAHGNTIPSPPQAPFSDGSPEMRKRAALE
jgi:hypothetical protein